MTTACAPSSGLAREARRAHSGGTARTREGRTHLRAVERVDAVRVVDAEGERVDLVGDVVRVRVERLELVHELPLRRLERLARRDVEVSRDLVDLEEAKQVAALVDAGEARGVEQYRLVLAQRVLLPLEPREHLLLVDALDVRTAVAALRLVGRLGQVLHLRG